MIIVKYLTPIISIILFVALSSQGVAEQSGNFTAYYINVGQGDSELVQFHGHNILIDGGETNEGSTVASFLRSHNVSSIDLVVNTHPDADHLGGLKTIIDDFPVLEILNDGLTDTTKNYQNFVADVTAKGLNDQPEYAGMSINLDPSVTINVYAPPSNHLGNDTNTNSIVLKFTYGNEKFLFVGDASTTTENYMESAGDDLRADVLKVGHHGSDTSSSQSFLNAVRPEIAVIEVGLNNEYHLPDADIISRLQNDGATVYQTDLDGDIEVTTDGNSLSVYTHDNVPVAQISTSSSVTSTPQPVVTGTISPTVIPTATPIATPNPTSSGDNAVYGCVCCLAGILFVGCVAILLFQYRRRKMKGKK